LASQCLENTAGNLETGGRSASFHSAIYLSVLGVVGIIQRQRQRLLLKHRSWRALHTTQRFRARYMSSRVRTDPAPGSRPSRSMARPDRSRIFFWTGAGLCMLFFTRHYMGMLIFETGEFDGVSTRIVPINILVPTVSTPSHRVQCLDVWSRQLQTPLPRRSLAGMRLGQGPDNYTVIYDTILCI